MENPTTIPPEEITVGQRIRFRLEGEVIWTATVVELAPNNNHDKVLVTDVEYTDRTDRSLISLRTEPGEQQEVRIFWLTRNTSIEVI